MTTRVEGFLVGATLTLLGLTLPAGLVALAAGATEETVRAILFGGLGVAWTLLFWAGAAWLVETGRV